VGVGVLHLDEMLQHLRERPDVDERRVRVDDDDLPDPGLPGVGVHRS
jgi:hypothetical protein